MPKFSIVVIARNEEKTLPRLLKSLESFKLRGGEVVVLDTGSTDNTAKIAREWGCVVEEVGAKFIRYIDGKMAKKINRQFKAPLDNGEIVKEGDKNFDFASARNYAASLASNDFIFTPDADEIYTKLDIDAVEKYIDDGYQQLEFNFVFAHGPNGEETIKFIQCKGYDRRVMSWDGIVHEVLIGNAKRTLMPESVFKIEHYQNQETNRSGYLVGLAVDCFENPKKDRNSHYFARELWYRGFIHSAQKEFERYLTISWWDAERAKTMVYLGDIAIALGKEKEGLDWYHKAIAECFGTREALIRLGKYYFDKEDWKRAVFYLEGSLLVEYSGFYADDMNNYKDYPLGLLYVAYHHFDTKKAKEYWEKALKIDPQNTKYIADGIYYQENNDEGENIEGWMMPIELEFLRNNAKKFKDIVEIGSWKGRSTFALLKNCPGTVHSVDTFLGSEDPLDTGHIDVYDEFFKNVGHFKNLVIHRKKSVEGAKDFEDGSMDMVFIDAGHQYHEVKEDIEAWKHKCKILLCGHDYNWPPVAKAVIDTIGEPDGVCGTIWFKWLGKEDNWLDLFTEKLEKGENFNFIKRGDGEELCMRGNKGCNCDGSIYYPELGHKLKYAYEFFKGRKDCYVPEFEYQYHFNCLLHREDNDLNKLKKFFYLIKNSDRRKIYVGPKRLKIVSVMLGCEFIEVPELDGFKYYDDILSNILGDLTDNYIVLFSAGMMAKPLIAECLDNFENITCIDIGSSFDPIINNTRTGQIGQPEMFKLYEGYLPLISILIPTLGRVEGLKRCLESITRLNYPKDRIEVIYREDEPRIGVAKRLNELFRESSGEWIVYGSNDIEFEPNSLLFAVAETKGKSLIAFNTGDVLPDEGNICEHFMINRKYVISGLGGKIFDEDFNHVGVDNLLWSKCESKTRADLAVIKHYHFSKGYEMDDIYKLGWDKVEEDRELLKKKLA